MRNGIYLFLCMLFLVLVLGGCAGTRHSFQTTPTQEDGIVEEAGTETISEPGTEDTAATPLAYEYETQELYAKRDENRIYGVVYVPQNAGEKMQAVIFSHGFGGNYQVGTQYAVEAYDSARLEVLPGAGHGFYGSDAEQAVDWMQEYLEAHKQ